MAKKEEEKKEEKLVMVGDGSELSETEEAALPPEKKAAPLAGDLDEEDVEGLDEGDREADRRAEDRVGHGEEEDADREALRETRRAERKRRRQREARNRLELDFLRKRNEQVERQLSQLAQRQDQQEDVTVSQRIGQLESQMREAETILSAAVKASDGETVAEAMRVRDTLGEHLTKLRGVKESKAKRTPDESDGESRREAPRPPNPEILRNLQGWMGRNKWFDPTLEDETSHFVKVMEDRLATEGEFTADDPEYWKELDRRVAKRFPNLKSRKKVSREEIFEEDDEDEEDEPAPKPTKKRNGGPRFSVGGRARALRPNEVHVDAERRAAMEELGVWEDPELRERYLRSYQRYDKEAQNNK